MNYQDSELLEDLVGRFVIGTMPHRSRRRFSRIVDQSEAVSRMVYELEAMMLPGAWALEPLQPSELVWQRISRSAGFGKRKEAAKPRAPVWQGMAAALVAGLFITSFGWYQAHNRAPEVVIETVTETVIEPVPVKPTLGIIENADGNAIWVANIYDDLAEADVVVRAAPERKPENDYQLWILRDDGIPVSLGLLPQAGESTLALSDAALDGLKRGSTIAVSLEPLGGSPEAVPTGPVLFTAALMTP